VITLDDIRSMATAFPRSRNSPTSGSGCRASRSWAKAFAGMEKGETTAVFSISHEEAAKAVADDPATYEKVRRPDATKSFVGLRVDLAKVPEERVQELVEHAWRNKAPNRMVAAYDAQ
jgi:hypothetical protein